MPDHSRVSRSPERPALEKLHQDNEVAQERLWLEERLCLERLRQSDVVDVMETRPRQHSIALAYALVSSPGSDDAEDSGPTAWPATDLSSPPEEFLTGPLDPSEIFDDYEGDMSELSHQSAFMSPFNLDSGLVYATSAGGPSSQKNNHGCCVTPTRYDLPSGLPQGSPDTAFLVDELASEMPWDIDLLASM